MFSQNVKIKIIIIFYLIFPSNNTFLLYVPEKRTCVAQVSTLADIEKQPCLLVICGICPTSTFFQLHADWGKDSFEYD